MSDDEILEKIRGLNGYLVAHNMAHMSAAVTILWSRLDQLKRSAELAIHYIESSEYGWSRGTAPHLDEVCSSLHAAIDGAKDTREAQLPMADAPLRELVAAQARAAAEIAGIGKRLVELAAARPPGPDVSRLLAAAKWFHALAEQFDHGPRNPGGEYASLWNSHVAAIAEHEAVLDRIG